MAKLTIEIDMDDSQETWDSLYRRIEQFDEEPADEAGTPRVPATPQMTYDLLLDPEHAFGDVRDFFAVLSGQD
jgi:hypothetical protein